MERLNCSTKPEAPRAGIDRLLEGADFPVAPEFEAILQSASLAHLVRAREGLSPTYLGIPGEMERRKGNVIMVEFTM